MASQPSFDDAVWQTARRCTNGNCVEVAYRDGHVAVRNSKAGPSDSIVVFTQHEWTTFLDAVRNGEFSPADEVTEGM
ncbi:DUF397 domain-containing protein [Microbispora sp. H10836]|uniref:DUF397 domain-containing protein n=1 Tax=Microbispora sp. H10836 TaxID=2729106 RepID=UPI00147564A0|nr:DUF397 domain-containing protein [Microbispora sp. H10836]